MPNVKVATSDAGKFKLIYRILENPVYGRESRMLRELAHALFELPMWQLVNLELVVSMKVNPSSKS